MAVHTRGAGFQANLTIDKKRYRKTFSKSADAQAWEQKIKFSIENNIEILGISGSKSWTYKIASDQCFEINWKGEKSEVTNEMNRRIVGDFMIHKFGTDEVDLNKITTLIVDDFVIYFRKKGNSDSTINRKLMCLSKIMKFAHERKKVVELPKLPLKKEPKGKIRWLTLEEDKLLLKYFDFPWTRDYLDYFIVAIDTGLRTSEMLRLEKSAILEKRIKVELTKSGEPRKVGLTPRAKRVLERRSRALKDDEKVFMLTKTKLRYRFDVMRKDIPELKDVHPHVLRHTFCSRLVQLGAPLANVQELMGHEVIETTMRYAHLAPDHDASDISLLSKYVTDL